MRILFLAINYAPEPISVSPFNTGLAEALAQDGHEVTVITAFPYYPAWRTHEEYRGHVWMTERLNGVRVLRVWLFVPSRPRVLVQRLLHDLTFSLHALLVGALRGGRADVVICSSPPPFLAIAAWLLARLRRARLVTKVTDISSSAAAALGIVDDRLGRLAQRIEGFAFSRADRVAMLTAAFRPPLEAMSVRPERMVQIPDWAELEELRPQARDNEFRAEVLPLGESFLVLHTGNMGLKQGLETMVEAAPHAAAGSRWLVVGEGEQRAAVQARAGDRVSFLPLQPRERFPRVLAAADVLLLVQRATVTDQVIPSKLLTYLAAGRPVIVAADGTSEAARIVGEADCGVVVPPEDPVALAAAVDRLRDDPARCAAFGRRARAYAEAHFAREAVLDRYRALLRELTEPRA